MRLTVTRTNLDMEQQRVTRLGISTHIQLFICVVALSAGAVGGQAVSDQHDSSDMWVDSIRAPVTFDRDTVKRLSLSNHTRLLLNDSLLNKRTSVNFVAATREHRVAEVRSQIIALGGQITRRIDAVGYIRGQLSPGAVSRAFALPDVVDLEIDASYLYSEDAGGDIEYFNRQSERGLWQERIKKQRAAQERRISEDCPSCPEFDGRGLPPLNVYIPTGDIHAPQFISEHPTYDGRGVGIAVVEGMPDSEHPVFKYARSLQGQEIPKIDHIITSPALFRDAPSEFTFRFGSFQPAVRRHVRHDGVEYAVPNDGEFAVATAPLTWGGSRVPFAALLDRKRGLIYVDLDQNAEFSESEQIKDWNDRRQLFRAGVTADSPRFAPVLSQDRMVILMLPVLGHTTAVAGIAAGQEFLNSAANGVAPGARIIVSPLLGTARHKIPEAIVDAIFDPDVDVVTCSSGDQDLPLDGDSVGNIIVARAARLFDKPVFISASNRGRYTEELNQLGAHDGIIMVGGYLGSKTSQTLLAVDIANEGAVSRTSAHGPTALGALKPDVIAPNTSVVARLCEEQAPYRALPGSWLPRCYRWESGTSLASPMASGAAALLISAAKQKGIAHDLEQFTSAFFGGATFLASVAANEQGRGLVQIDKAWDLLSSQQRRIQVDVAAPVRHEFTRYSKTGNVGLGIYDRLAGPDDIGRTTLVWLKRASGAPEAITFRTRWLGNDGTFEGPDQVSLPLEKAVAVAIRLVHLDHGLHSALFELLDYRSGISIATIPMTVISPFELSDHVPVEFSTHEIDPVHPDAAVYVKVGADAHAISVSASAQPAEAIVLQHKQAGLGSGYMTAHFPYLVSVGEMWLGTAPLTFEYPAPMPGVLEFHLTESEYEHPSREPVSSALRVALNRASSPVTQEGKAEEILSARTGRPLAITVQEGTAQLAVRVEADSRGKGDYDLFLYDCTAAGACKLWNLPYWSEANKEVVVPNPSAGKWQIVIDAIHPARLDSRAKVIINQCSGTDERTTLPVCKPK